jgi:hypothetical protein
MPRASCHTLTDTFHFELDSPSRNVSVSSYGNQLTSAFPGPALYPWPLRDRALSHAARHKREERERGEVSISIGVRNRSPYFFLPRPSSSTRFG